MLMVGLNAAQLSEMRAAKYDVVLNLGLREDWEAQGSGVVFADAYAHFSDGYGLSNVWIGDVRIDGDEACMSPIGENVSWSSLNSKITECFKTHSECQPNTQYTLPRGFRLIDVKKRCLVDKTSCRFVALSYVWGSKLPASLLTGTRATLDTMKQEGGLPASQMPQTIEDAIAVCIQMGEKYLWADRLCIMQDDPDDLKNQIEAMGEIYSSAQIVLVAAYGDSMEYGIPGVGQPRKARLQRSVDILDMRLTNLVRDIEDDPLSLWDTRGWTYQEAVLSNRRLYFSNTRAFFECERVVCHEDQFNVEEVRHELHTTRLTLPEDKSRFESFARHLMHYTSRNLTYRADAYKALYGISKSFYHGISEFVYGLPIVDFDRALLWFAESGRSPLQRQEIQAEILPTWSWSSLLGQSDHAIYSGTEFYGTLAPWVHISAHGPLPDSVPALNVNSETEPDDGWQTYMALAGKEGLVDTAPLELSLTTHNFATIRHLFNTQWSDYHSFRKQVIPTTMEGRQIQHAISATSIKQGLIATRTQTVSLRLRTRPRPLKTIDIINAEGQTIGELCGDAEYLREQLDSTEYGCRDDEYEFIALSLSGAPIRLYHKGKLDHKKYVDVDGCSLDTIPIVNVLMIARQGARLSRRRELGWVYLKDWACLRREWTVIVLE
ncbi:heterokaryon incompatibility protein-domain-containing protein [Aspergillus carlsbadensis]|nr:heterokaryon incompatibility protein-domain-containing protein [Aspergillus carlsbadensis]